MSDELKAAEAAVEEAERASKIAWSDAEKVGNREQTPNEVWRSLMAGDWSAYDEHGAELDPWAELDWLSEATAMKLSDQAHRARAAGQMGARGLIALAREVAALRLDMALDRKRLKRIRAVVGLVGSEGREDADIIRGINDALEASPEELRALTSPDALRAIGVDDPEAA